MIEKTGAIKYSKNPLRMERLEKVKESTGEKTYCKTLDRAIDYYIKKNL